MATHGQIQEPEEDNVEGLFVCPPSQNMTMGATAIRIDSSLVFLVFAVLVTMMVLLFQWQRIRTRRRLESCGLPTVYWTPKFWRYKETQEQDQQQQLEEQNNHYPEAAVFNQKPSLLSSTTITRILPRMERLKGPYGVYGTVYGIRTSVVHVAHPLPARAILMSTMSGSSDKYSNSDKSNTQKKRRLSSISLSSSLAMSTGASKQPAYNHFKNFCGDGVFTADGNDWKSKRSAVLHHLVKGVTSSSSSVAVKLEREANHAANVFRHQIRTLRQQHKEPVIRTNVVPLLQRSTVGLIYRYLTHHDPDWAILPLSPLSNIEQNVDHRSSIRTAGKNDQVELAAASNQSPHADSETVSSSSSASSEDDISEEQTLPSPTSRGSESIQETEASPKNHSQPESKSKSKSKSTLLDSYLQAIVRIRMIILAQSRSVWFLLPRWCYRWFSSLYQDEEQTLQPIRQFADLACQNAQPGSPIYKLAVDPSGPYFGSNNDKPESSQPRITKDLLDEAITLLFAGQDTSAATLSWTLHLLSLHSKIQQRLADEVIGVIEEAQVSSNHTDDLRENLKKKPVTITRSMINKMVFLDAVIKESMRLYPVAPFVVRRFQHDIIVPVEEQEQEQRTSIKSSASGKHDDSCQNQDSKDVVLPEGSVACLWIYGMHRNGALWDRPDDFVPDRWIDPELKDIGPMMGAYMPFAAGPRNCVGQPLAHIILRTLLAHLIYSYQFIDERLGSNNGDDDDDKSRLLRKDMQAGFTVLPSGGVFLEIQDRDH
mmetsp:Transcript_24779/g.58792  ORF Transcript_24779/g.58792 Transcript_24779/m.58792 type:complete len:768 (-) Transcript_24779:277-2580(-)